MECLLLMRKKMKTMMVVSVSKTMMMGIMRTIEMMRKW